MQRKTPQSSSHWMGISNSTCRKKIHLKSQRKLCQLQGRPVPGFRMIHVGRGGLFPPVFFEPRSFFQIFESPTYVDGLFGWNLVERWARWWFQVVFIFTPIWGRFPSWLMFFKWVETTNWWVSFLIFFLCVFLRFKSRWFMFRGGVDFYSSTANSRDFVDSYMPKVVFFFTNPIWKNIPVKKIWIMIFPRFGVKIEHIFQRWWAFFPKVSGGAKTSWLAHQVSLSAFMSLVRWPFLWSQSVLGGDTWRGPSQLVNGWLGSPPIYKPWMAICKGNNPYLRELTITMVISPLRIRISWVINPPDWNDRSFAKFRKFVWIVSRYKTNKAQSTGFAVHPKRWF